MTHEGQETGSAGDTELGQLSVSSYNGSLGGQQTLLRPEGGKGREKKNPPSGWDEDEAACPWGPCPLFHPSWEGTMTSPCNPNPARPGQIRPDVCLRSRRPLAPTVEDGPEECFQAQAAVTVPELCEEVKE